MKVCMYVCMYVWQGCGKTTFSEVLRRMLLHTNIECVSMSLDDFYLTGREQDNLTQENSGNFLLRCRGNGMYVCMYACIIGKMFVTMDIYTHCIHVLLNTDYSIYASRSKYMYVFINVRSKGAPQAHHN